MIRRSKGPWPLSGGIVASGLVPVGFIMMLASLWVMGSGASWVLAGSAPTATALQGEQGDVLVVRLPVEGRPRLVTGTFLKRSIPFVPGSDPQEYVGLLGIDMQDPPGPHRLEVALTYPDKTTTRSLQVQVVKHAYPEQRLKLPKNMVTLDKKTLARVQREAKAVRAVFREMRPTRLWHEPFLKPLEGRISGRFGSRRIINGEPRNPHSGEDIAAPRGTEVVAPNAGIVQMTMDHFFTGKGVILDHGLGLFSMYFHLAAVDVQEGDTVQRGQVIGKVGSTGRATGPHLHWGIRLNGARVNPYALLSIPVEDLSP